LQFYLTDALNSVVNLTNNSGAVQARYQYDAWGNKRNEVGSSWNRFGFTGHEHDEETGLIYAKARFYDPDTGRFLGEDAWEGDVMLPPSLHKYLYAYQNPTVYWDPDGNEAKKKAYTKKEAKKIEKHCRGKYTSACASKALRLKEKNYDSSNDAPTAEQRNKDCAASKDCDLFEEANKRGIQANENYAQEQKRIKINEENERIASAKAADPTRVLADNRAYSERRREALADMGTYAEIATGVVNPGKGFFDSAEAVSDLITFARNNPGVTLGVAATAACTANSRCRGLIGKSLRRDKKSDGAESRVGSAGNDIYSDTKPLDNEFPELVGVNPHYVPGAAPGVNTNCVSCANASQRRLLGTEPDAVASPSNGYGTPNDLLPSAPFGFQPPTTPAGVRAQMLESGNGSVGVVRVQQGGSVEHVINVVNRDGKVYFIDSQSGKVVNLKPDATVRLGTP